MANNNDYNNRKMTAEEAGCKDGELTARNHDKEFYQEIGEKGGESRARQRDDDSQMSKENDRKAPPKQRDGIDPRF